MWEICLLLSPSMPMMLCCKSPECQRVPQHSTKFLPSLLLSCSLDLAQMGIQLSPAPSQWDSDALWADDAKEHFGGHCLRRQNSLHVWKILLQPILEMKLLIILLHSIPLWLIKRDSQISLCLCCSSRQKTWKFPSICTWKERNCHFWKGLTKSQANSPAEHWKPLPNPRRMAETQAVPGKHFYCISSRQIKHTSG